MFDETNQLPDVLLDRQRQMWFRGECPSIDELLAGTPYAGDCDAELDLLYNEVVIREELGQKPCVADYIPRYPHLQAELELHFEIHRVVNDQVLLQTESPRDDSSVPLGNPLSSDAPLSLPDYEIGPLLGHGGMAEVFRARHRRLNRNVALKVFRSGRFLTSRESFRIRNEAEAMARLTDPHIIQIFEIGDCEGAPYLALELAEQGTLAQRLQKFPLESRDAAQLIATLALAVEHAHERQIIHRDLKPANVLFTANGVAKITDFGLAKVLTDDDRSHILATHTGETLGTPRYMAPEQAAGEHHRVGVQTDVYALGTLLYECLTGQAPFVAAGVADTLQKIRFDDPLPPRRLQAAIPRDLETICLKCLEKAPERRYASARFLAVDLQRFLDGEPISARPTPAWERAWKWARRKPAQAALIAGGILIVVASMAAAIIFPQLENRRVSGLRSEVARLMLEGRHALERDDPDLAQARFQSAWMIVRAEPALADHETSVAGWLDHTRNQANRYVWKQRVPPRTYDDRRDEALLLSLLLLPDDEHPLSTARAAIGAALELTLPADPAWQLEREQLRLLEAELVSRESGPQAGLALLAGTKEFSSRRFHRKRADLLEQCGRSEESAAARAEADRFPAVRPVEQFQTGMDQMRMRHFEAAIDTFEQVLQAEPEHFAARLFQALGFIQLERFREARVALTACVAQRPLFQWCYFYRGQVEMALGDVPAAQGDFRRALEGRPSEAMRQAVSALRAGIASEEG